MVLLTLLIYCIILMAKQIKMIWKGLSGHGLVSKLKLESQMGKLVMELSCKLNLIGMTIPFDK